MSYVHAPTGAPPTTARFTVAGALHTSGRPSGTGEPTYATDGPAVAGSEAAHATSPAGIDPATATTAATDATVTIRTN